MAFIKASKELAKAKIQTPTEATDVKRETTKPKTIRKAKSTAAAQASNAGQADCVADRPRSFDPGDFVVTFGEKWGLKGKKISELNESLINRAVSWVDSQEAVARAEHRPLHSALKDFRDYAKDFLVSMGVTPPPAPEPEDFVTDAAKIEPVIENKELTKGVDEMDRYVIVRTYAMGVFAGTLLAESTETLKVLKNARRIWYWAGAASLSQLAIEGTAKPNECKFPCEVSRVELTSPQGFEVLDVTDKARESIANVPVWKQ